MVCAAAYMALQQKIYQLETEKKEYMDLSEWIKKCEEIEQRNVQLDEELQKTKKLVAEKDITISELQSKLETLQNENQELFDENYGKKKSKLAQFWDSLTCW